MTTTRVAALALWVLLSPVPRLLAAQDATVPAAKPAAYQVTGIVTDSSGAPVPEADVAVIESGTVRRQVATDAAGRFEFRDVPAGQIAIRVRRLGYQPRTVDAVVGATTSTTSLEIIVTPVPAQLEEVRVQPNP